MTTIDVIEPGTEVEIGPPNAKITGLLTEVSIKRGCRPQYRVVWWDGRARRAEWLDPCEVESANEYRVTQIGFRKQ